MLPFQELSWFVGYEEPTKDDQGPEESMDSQCYESWSFPDDYQMITRCMDVWKCTVD